LLPYHSHLLLLNHVVIVVKLCCVEGLMDVHLISTLVNKSLYYYLYYSLFYVKETETYITHGMGYMSLRVFGSGCTLLLS